MAENRAWKKLPDEEGKWWYWNGEEESLPFIYSVEVSHDGKVRYFIDVGTGTWCDEMGGYWLKDEAPAPPTAVERADAEAAWLKRFEGTMKADTERVVEDTKIEGEKHEPTVDNRRESEMKDKKRSRAARKAARTRTDNSAVLRRWREVYEPASRRMTTLLNCLLRDSGTVSLRFNPLGDKCAKLKNGAEYGTLIKFLNGGRILRVLPDGYKHPKDYHPAYWEPLVPWRHQ